ncbi:C13 family peptidase [Piscinibacter sp. XHJ-5]|uniref:C13 family peptidase n=1 Tax=Piscinibacter sp. XHJ-5 TaxID=3037797 RepID=UPI0024535975|nr:C13 family peptidase [Piscinibacter sp. XHJ-5]
MQYDDQDPAAAPALGRGALGNWWREGARTALLMKPRWSGLQATPATVACLVLVPWAFGLLVQRLYIDGAASFYWPAIQAGWLPTALALWLCWLLVPRSGTPSDGAPSAAALFAMLAAQTLPISIALAIVTLPLVRSGAFDLALIGRWGAWIWWVVPLSWMGAAQTVLVLRSGASGRATRFAVAVLLVTAMALSQWSEPVRAWYPSAAHAADSELQPLKLTQDLMELQPRLLDEQLGALRPQRPGIVDVYAITFAPYADEDVFRREADMVAGVMEQRFDAAGRTMRLVNHRDTLRQRPWATPLNLQRAIGQIAARMNRDEDVLFIHLTSHGAQNGELAASFWPLTVEPVTPQALKAWLDAAGVRWKVISVSACYSGSWIAPLADAGSLVMTAADADHTSYGCGRKSELTFFGRAVFDEELRRTWSFEHAHAAARRVIERREREAGKSDGYSNPQIHVGDAIRERLGRLEAQLATGATR